MQKRWIGDLIWIALFAGFTAAVVSKSLFFQWTVAHPYAGGFVKFALLATMGELLAGRISKGRWTLPPAFPARVVIWGFFGMWITLAFALFSGGVRAAMESGLLPFRGNEFATAFTISALMNLIFAPTMMLAHRFTDAYLDLRFGERRKPRLADLVARMDMTGFFGFVVIKTIPLFWIPAHTVTFLLPSDYRVVVAAYLSIALGLLLSVARLRKRSANV